MKANKKKIGIKNELKNYVYGKWKGAYIQEIVQYLYKANNKEEDIRWKEEGCDILKREYKQPGKVISKKRERS